MQRIGKRIQKYRKAADLTGAELAEKASLTTTYISRVENGLVPGVSVDTVLKIARALEVPVSLILDEELSIEAAKAMDLIRSILKKEGELREPTLTIRKKKESV